MANNQLNVCWLLTATVQKHSELFSNQEKEISESLSHQAALPYIFINVYIMYKKNKLYIQLSFNAFLCFSTDCF